MSYHLQEINRRIQADPKEFVDASDAAYAAKIERAARAIAEKRAHVSDRAALRPVRQRQDHHGHEDRGGAVQAQI